MFRLLKFELKKSGKTMMLALAGFFIVNYAFLLKFKGDGSFTVSEFPFQVVFFIALSSALFVGSAIAAVNNLRLEVKDPTRDLYFTIPLSAYQKILSKIAFSTIQLVLAAGIALLTCLKH